MIPMEILLHVFVYTFAFILSIKFLSNASMLIMGFKMNMFFLTTNTIFAAISWVLALNVGKFKFFP